MPNRLACAVIGLGNIGSHTAVLLSRLPAVGRLILIDFDTIEERNVSSQGVRPTDVGRRKAVVLGRRLATLRDDLDVVVHGRRLEDVSLGDLRCDVLLGCLDSRVARTALNERALALGVALIDAGVSESGLLARTSVFGREGPCLECSWDDQAYADVEAVHACDGAVAPVSTSAPAFLGAAAAALQVAACAKVLSGDTRGLASETVLDLAHARLVVSSIRARGDCRMAPHRPWRIEPVAQHPAGLALREALDLGSRRAPGEDRTIRCSRGAFVTGLRCIACGSTRPRLRLAAALTRRDLRCRKCGGDNVFGGTDLTEKLEAASLAAPALKRSLASLGARLGDVLTVGTGDTTRHFEFVAGARR